MPVPYQKIPRGMVHRDEHPIFVRSIEDAAKLGGDFIEIGTRRGASLRAILATLSMVGVSRRVMTIDPKPVMAKVRKVIMESCSDEFVEIAEVRSDDVSADRAKDASWIFVDGCHCFECCRRDIDRFGRQLPPGAYLVVHDINTGMPDTITYSSRQYCYRMGAPTISAVHPVVLTSEVLNNEFELVEKGGEIDGIGVWRKL